MAGVGEELSVTLKDKSNSPNNIGVQGSMEEVDTFDIIVIPENNKLTDIGNEVESKVSHVGIFEPGEISDVDSGMFIVADNGNTWKITNLIRANGFCFAAIDLQE